MSIYLYGDYEAQKYFYKIYGKKVYVVSTKDYDEYIRYNRKEYYDFINLLCIIGFLLVGFEIVFMEVKFLFWMGLL